MKELEFWMVWCPLGNPPKARHESERSAEGEAERLVGANPDLPFYVLHAVAKFSATRPVEKTVLDKYPF